jgi:hypothetical protein
MKEIAAVVGRVLMRAIVRLGGRAATAEWDLAVLFHEGRRYWVNLIWTDDTARLVVRVWDREHPIHVQPACPQWARWAWWRKPEECVMSYLKREVEVDTRRRLEANVEAKKWAERHPALWEYLTSTKYPDGGARQTSTLLLFVEDGVWKACLKDRDTGRSLWIASGSPTEAMTDLELTLAAGDAEWRKDKQWQPAKKGSK